MLLFLLLIDCIAGIESFFDIFLFLQESAVDDVIKEFHATTIHVLVKEGLNHAVDKRGDFRKNFGAFLRHLMQRGLVNPATFVRGVNDFVATAEDIIVDIPKFWDFLGECLGNTTLHAFSLAHPLVTFHSLWCSLFRTASCSCPPLSLPLSLFYLSLSLPLFYPSLPLRFISSSLFLCFISPFLCFISLFLCVISPSLFLCFISFSVLSLSLSLCFIYPSLFLCFFSPSFCPLSLSLCWLSFSIALSPPPPFFSLSFLPDISSLHWYLMFSSQVFSTYFMQMFSPWRPSRSNFPC